MSAILMNLNISSSIMSTLDLQMWNISECISCMCCCFDVFWFVFYCNGGLAYISLRLRITSVIVINAKYVEITTMHGIRKIVGKNNILDKNIYIAISAAVKSIVETYLFLVVRLLQFCILFFVSVN